MGNRCAKRLVAKDNGDKEKFRSGEEADNHNNKEEVKDGAELESKEIDNFKNLSSRHDSAENN